MRQKLVVAVCAACFGIGAAHAAPFNSFDPRSMAMGGAGAAVGNAATAPFFNPSLLSTTEHEDDFAMELPIIGGRLHDPDELRDRVDKFQKNPELVINNKLVLDTSVNHAKSTFEAINRLDPTSPTYINDVKAAAAAAAATLGTADTSGTVSGDSRKLNAGLADLSHRTLNVEAGVGTVIGIPSRKIGAALFINSWNVASAIMKYEDADLLEGLAKDTTTFANKLNDVATCTTPDSCREALAVPPDLTYIKENGGQIELAFDPDKDIKSSIELRGLSLNEVGLSLSREFSIAGTTFALGVTPKYVRAITVDYQATVNEAKQSNLNASDYTNDTSNFNMDLGIAKDFENGWRAGMVVKNIIGQTYELKRKINGVKVKTGEIELKPQARAGVSYQNSWLTAGLDVDLTENAAVGFEDKTRYVAMGVELNAARWAQLRLGYRANTVNSDYNIASAGIGLSPFGVHIDLAVAASDKEIGGAAQIGVRF